jgi:predicted O-linked N-acetylglucosamine transferase (SPINDLY family)
LHLLGLVELIAATSKEYVAKALALSGNRKRLLELRGELRDRVLASPLLDGELFARDMSALLVKLYEEVTIG